MATLETSLAERRTQRGEIALPIFIEPGKFRIDRLLGLDVGPLGCISRRPAGHFRRCPEATSFFALGGSRLVGCGKVGPVRFGSLADIASPFAHVRFTPNSGDPERRH